MPGHEGYHAQRVGGREGRGLPWSYFLAVALTGEAFIIERASGLLDRSWIAGVRPSEILASHILVQFCVMLVQTAVTLATILLVFNIPCRGPLEWLAILTMLQVSNWA